MTWTETGTLGRSRFGGGAGIAKQKMSNGYDGGSLEDKKHFIRIVRHLE